MADSSSAHPCGSAGFVSEIGYGRALEPLRDDQLVTASFLHFVCGLCLLYSQLVAGLTIEWHLTVKSAATYRLLG